MLQEAFDGRPPICIGYGSGAAIFLASNDAKWTLPPHLVTEGGFTDRTAFYANQSLHVPHPSPDTISLDETSAPRTVSRALNKKGDLCRSPTNSPNGWGQAAQAHKPRQAGMISLPPNTIDASARMAHLPRAHTNLRENRTPVSCFCRMQFESKVASEGAGSRRCKWLDRDAL